MDVLRCKHIPSRIERSIAEKHKENREAKSGAQRDAMGTQRQQGTPPQRIDELLRLFLSSIPFVISAFLDIVFVVAHELSVAIEGGFELVLHRLRTGTGKNRR